jgi:predicted adenine nucleotide alpha hydrolase (AANH) superfamily ATPase
MATEHGVEFYYEDFRLGWREGVLESKAMGLYRQQYCGCTQRGNGIVEPVK